MAGNIGQFLQDASDIIGQSYMANQQRQAEMKQFVQEHQALSDMALQQNMKQLQQTHQMQTQWEQEQMAPMGDIIDNTLIPAYKAGAQTPENALALKQLQSMSEAIKNHVPNAMATTEQLFKGLPGIPKTPDLSPIWHQAKGSLPELAGRSDADIYRDPKAMQAVNDKIAELQGMRNPNVERQLQAEVKQFRQEGIIKTQADESAFLDRRRNEIAQGKASSQVQGRVTAFKGVAGPVVDQGISAGSFDAQKQFGRGPQGVAAASYLAENYPNQDPSKLASNWAFKNDKQLNTAVSWANAVLPRLDGLQAKLEKLNPTDFPTVNSIKNWIYKQTGVSDITALDAAVNSTLMEAQRALGSGAQMTDLRLNLERGMLDRNLAPGQFKAAVGNVISAIQAMKNARNILPYTDTRIDPSLSDTETPSPEAMQKKRQEDTMRLLSGQGQPMPGATSPAGATGANPDLRKQQLLTIFPGMGGK